MMFPQIDDAGVSLMTRDLKDGPAITVLTASEMQGINSFQWLPDGRLFYSVPEPGAITSTINFWAMRLDAMGKPIEKPRRVTNLTGFGMVPTSVSQDSKRLAFLQWAFHATVYVADLHEDGTRISNARHVTLTEGGRVLWHVDLRGSTRQIWKNRGGNWALGLPSPNGRYLAIESSDNSQNMWMMEKF